MDSGKVKLDDPPYSRLFIVCSKNITEEELRNTFQKYGTIEQIWVVKDTKTKEPKGITYIKFSKTSEAAVAMQEMNGFCIGSHTKPLYIRIAQSRDSGTKEEVSEEETLLRLFCVVPKTTTEEMLQDHFKQFGELEYVSVVKDKETKDSKGVAYVKFHKFSDAAKAYEECNRLYKAVFAKPKTQKNPLEVMEPVASSAMMGFGSVFSPFRTNGSNFMNPEGFRTLRVIAPPNFSQNHLWRLFDLVPGLNCLKLDTKLRPGHAIAMYNNPDAAAYALKKLHGFEYPSGQRLIVKPELDHQSHLPMPLLPRGNLMGRDPVSVPTTWLDHPTSTPYSSAMKADLEKTMAQVKSVLQSGLAQGAPRNSYEYSRRSLNRQGMQTHLPMDIDTPERGHPMGRSPFSRSSAAQQPDNDFENEYAALSSTIMQAMSLIQGFAEGKTPSVNTTSYPSLKLPEPQPFAPMGAETSERLFVVCQPYAVPTNVLMDLFGRFGNLIDVHLLSGKNYGYVKYASKESAEQAVKTLHGQEICGSVIKVKTADPPSNGSRKRIRMTNE